MRRVFPLAALLLFLIQLVGCETLGYYGQAIGGQMYIMTHRKQISRLLDDPATPERLKSSLARVLEIRDFAEDELGLPAAGQFTSYVDLHRPYVVWNVFATEEFSLRPLSWCYPVAGCVSYRGYFSEDAARRKAEDLRRDGYDVHVGGVTAYSTLGWFSDPILNTVMDRGEHQLASLVFHELAHQVAYAKGDTVFNESFASTVEQVGLRRWVERTHSAAEGEALLSSVREGMRRREQFVALVQHAVQDLRILYNSELPPEEMRRQKLQRLELLRLQYQDLKLEWGGGSGYDSWFDDELNNARLATISTYTALVPAFQELLDKCEQNLDCFYAEARRLAALSRRERVMQLESKGT